MDDKEINDRVPNEIKELCESFELQMIAIWVTEDTTEVYLCETDPEDETLSRIEQLSQSLIG